MPRPDDPRPSNALHERYASREMRALWTPERRYGLWREIWIALAEAQSELGLPILAGHLETLRRAAPRLDLERVAEIEAKTRHDVVAHLRHFAEQAGEAGGMLHLGATSAFVTDNADAVIVRQSLELLEGRLAAAIEALAGFARRTRSIPALGYTHLQPAQLTTVGKRACLWIQDLLEDLEETRRRRRRLRCRGAKGTTGSQASFLALFRGDHAKVVELDRRVAEKLGFEESWAVTGQTYPRKQDSQVLSTLAGLGESCHKLGTDVRLLQGLGELTEPFGKAQVGSSAMAYKRNPIRAERMCSLARRLMTDSLQGPLTAGVNWLERSLDDSAVRRLVLTDAFLTADAVVSLAGYVGGGLAVREAAVAARVERELPFRATEEIRLQATVRGGDRQALHERLRELSMEAHAAVEAGGENPLLGAIAGDESFPLTRADLERLLDPKAFTGRAPLQVEEFLEREVAPALEGTAAADPEPIRV